MKKKKKKKKRKVSASLSIRTLSPRPRGKRIIWHAGVTHLAGLFPDFIPMFGDCDLVREQMRGLLVEGYVYREYTVHHRKRVRAGDRLYVSRHEHKPVGHRVEFVVDSTLVEVTHAPYRKRQ